MLLDGQTTNSKCRYRCLYKVMTFLSISFQKQVFFYLSYILFRCPHLLTPCWLIGMTEVALPLPGRNGYFSIKMTEVGWRERILLHQVCGWLVVAKRQSYWDNVLLSLVNKEYLAGMSIEIVKYLFNRDNPRIFLLKLLVRCWMKTLLCVWAVLHFCFSTRIFMEPHFFLHADEFNLLNSIFSSFASISIDKIGLQILMSYYVLLLVLC